MEVCHTGLDASGPLHIVKDTSQSSCHPVLNTSFGGCCS